MALATDKKKRPWWEFLFPYHGRSWWVIFGWMLVCLAAVGDAITNIGNLAELALLPGGSLLLVAEIFLFLGTMAIQYYIGRKIIPDLIEHLIVKKDFFAEFKDQPARLWILRIGVVLALATGVAAAALTYTYVIEALATTIFIGGLSAACPPLGIIFALAAGIFIASLFINSMKAILKRKNIIQDLKDYFNSLFRYEVDGKKRHLFAVYLEGIFTIVLSFAIAGLAVIGLVAINQLANKDLTAILSKIPNGIHRAIVIVSTIITMGISLVAQVPFAIHTVCSFIAKINDWMVSNWDAFTNALEKIFLSTEHAVFFDRKRITDFFASLLKLETWKKIGFFICKLFFVTSSALIPFAGARGGDRVLTALSTAGGAALATCEIMAGEFELESPVETSALKTVAKPLQLAGQIQLNLTTADAPTGETELALNVKGSPRQSSASISSVASSAEGVEKACPTKTGSLPLPTPAPTALQPVQ